MKCKVVDRSQTRGQLIARRFGGAGLRGWGECGKKAKQMPAASLVVQWLRIRLPMQGTQVRALVWEDPTCHGAARAHAPQLLNLCSRAHEPQLLSPHATATEARMPRARALQQEKPPQ